MKMIVRKIFEPRREEKTRGQRKLHHERLHGLYSQENIIHTTISRMGLAGCLVLWKKEKRHAYRIW